MSNDLALFSMRRVAELEADAARYRHLQGNGSVAHRVRAQAYFWQYESRKQRSKAIDAAIAADEGASCMIQLQGGEPK